MPADRFFVDAPIGQVIALSGEEAHHLHVMRVRPGEEVEVVNGRGILARARIEMIDKKEASLEVISRIEHPTPKTRLILAQALPRFSALEWIVEKGTELGTTEFLLFPAERSEKKSLTEHQLQRLRLLAQSALKQCGRLFLPTITIHPSLDHWDKPQGTLYFGDVGSAPKLSNPSSHTLFFIGPEKGFSPTESERLQQFGAHGISLHENTLRTETAAIAALSQYFLAYAT